MKTNLSFVILIIIFTNSVKAQSNRVECLQDLYDKAAFKTFEILRIDTLLKFNDGIDSYSFYRIIQHRNDTTITIDDAEYKVKADTISENTDPEYSRIDIPVIPIRIDTIRDPDDKTYILGVDTIKSISVRYAKIYDLSSTLFFQTIRKVERMADFQGLEIVMINVAFFNSNKSHMELDFIKEEDFENIEYAKATFLFEQNGNMMTYPIIFKK